MLRRLKEDSRGSEKFNEEIPSSCQEFAQGSMSTHKHSKVRNSLTHASHQEESRSQHNARVPGLKSSKILLLVFLHSFAYNTSLCAGFCATYEMAADGNQPERLEGKRLRYQFQTRDLRG